MIFDNFACQEDTPEAYETLLLEALFRRSYTVYAFGSGRRSVGCGKTIQESWKNNKDASFPNYAAGSWGPEDSMELVKRQGHKWV